MTKVTYTSFYSGFTDGDGAKPVNAAFLNALETFLVPGWFDSAITSNGSGVLTASGLVTAGTLTVVGITNTGSTTTAGMTNSTTYNNSLAGITVNGVTSGSVTLYQDFIGNVKRVMIYQTNYRSGSGAQTIALPTAFTKGAVIRTGGIGVSGSGGMQLLASAAAQNLNIITTWAAGGGSVTTQTTIYAYSYAEMTTAFDTVSFPLNTTSAHTAFVLIEGQ